MREKIDARATFVALWCALLLLKAVVAARLPLFVDEAFYWQESRHLAWAYSDLPGLTAWLIRIGTTVFGEGTLALRMPFLLLASLVPWLVVRVTARESGERHGWLAGIATLLLPLSGSLGLMALPDTAMVLATLLCLDAGARLLRGVGYGAALQLALGLAIGALSHYRFAAVIGVGALALLALPQGRQALRDPRLWIAIAFGIAAWTPLLAWNFENAEAGLRFQLVDRHPWAWQWDGIWFIAIQALLATPLLFVALLWAGARGLRDDSGPVRFIALCGGLVVLGFFVLGFFADTERVSFHWPLPGLVALLPLLPTLLLAWPRWLRVLTWAGAGLGLAAVLGYYAFVSVPDLRAHRGDEVVPVEFRRLGRARRRRARGPRRHARRHPHRGRQLQGRGRTGFRARRCRHRGAGASGQPPARPRPAAAPLEPGGHRRHRSRRSGAAGDRRQRGRVQAPAAALPRAVPPLRSAAAAARAQRRPRPHPLPAVRHRRRAARPRRGVHAPGDGLG